MMKMRTSSFKALALAVMLVWAPSAYSQVLTADLQMLTQGEVRDGGVTAPNNDNPELQDRSTYIVGRARLNLDFNMGGLQLYVSPQYTGIWGQKGYGSFHMYEAWAKYTLRFGGFAQIGRQALSYDDQRIIGPNDWAMAAVSHDVLKLGYEGHGHKVHALLAYNQNPENVDGGTAYLDGAQPYKIMQTLWYHYDVPNIGLGASLLFMNLGVQADPKIMNKVIYQQMIGTHITYKPEWGDFSACYYHQSGRDYQNIPIDAWMAAVKGVVKTSKTIAVTAGYDILSGDPFFAVPEDGHLGSGQLQLVQRDKIRGFTTLYGSHHKFYGMMEFFYVDTYYRGFSPGLQNAYLGGDFTLWEKLNLSATYHYLATVTKLTDLKKTLGHCIELSATYNFNKYISLSGGFSFMKGTETMIRLKRQKDDKGLRWGWLTLVISPRILNANMKKQ